MLEGIPWQARVVALIALVALLHRAPHGLGEFVATTIDGTVTAAAAAFNALGLDTEPEATSTTAGYPDTTGQDAGELTVPAAVASELPCTSCAQWVGPHPNQGGM